MVGEHEQAKFEPSLHQNPVLNVIAQEATGDPEPGSAVYAVFSDDPSTAAAHYALFNDHGVPTVVPLDVEVLYVITVEPGGPVYADPDEPVEQRVYDAVVEMSITARSTVGPSLPAPASTPPGAVGEYSGLGRHLIYTVGGDAVRDVPATDSGQLDDNTAHSPDRPTVMSKC